MDMQEILKFLTLCLPRTISRALVGVSELRELRIRTGRPVILRTSEGDRSINFLPTQEQVDGIAESLCEHALYARSEETKQGFVTLRGGHRMGLCGRVIMVGQTVRALREISSLCVRIAGQWNGAADALLPHLIDSQGRLLSLLVVGPPASGKTTILRDACRQLSDRGYHMALADERSELAAASHGVPQLDVGANTDVLDGCHKELSMRWLLRAMNPDALVTDELGVLDDAMAVLDAAQSGVAVLASAHGRTLEQTLSRNTMYQLVRQKAFSRYAVLDGEHVGQIAELYDESMRPIDLRGSQP